MPIDHLLSDDARARYADAIVKTSLGFEKGDTLVIYAEPEHRELVIAVAEAGYRAGARIVDLIDADPLLARARLEYGSDEALGVISPWALRRFREVSGPHGSFVAIAGEGEEGYLDGVPPDRIRTDFARRQKQLGFFRRAQLNMTAPWVIAGWPTELWARQVYPDLDPGKGKRRLAADLLSFCRLTDEDGKGTSGLVKHLRALVRRSERLTKLALTRLELRGPGTELDLGFAEGTRWLGGGEEMPGTGKRIAANIPTEEVFTSPDPRQTSGTFRCTFPLSLRGRLIEGLRGEFSAGRLVRLEADSDDDRDFVATYLDVDRGGRRLGEVALVDASSRIGQTGRIYYNTLLDENAAAHIAFGSGFDNTRAGKPVRGVNRSAMHLDVMIGGPDLEATGIDARGRRIPLIRDGLWQI
jgi:aminopeptidase